MLESILRKLSPFNARLVAVSKTHQVDAIRQVYAAGHRVFGENRVQELLEKQPQLPADIEWHLIGHLQKNKVRSVVPVVAMIHSVDSFELLQTIDNEAVRFGRVVDCLLQFHIAKEVSKFGFEENSAIEMLGSGPFSELKNVRICGVMGMATFTEDLQQIRSEFRALKSIFDRLKVSFFPNSPYFKEISMGMSGDFEVALEEGATLVRIGSLLFGAR